MEIKKIDKALALAGFSINAIKFQPDNPFTWASGWKSPVYNDNRMFLFSPHHRALIVSGFAGMVQEINLKVDVIAGTSTAGIPHGYGLAQLLCLPFIYVRDKPKDHGMKNRIEGIDAGKDLESKKVLLIEDLVSTGGSSVSAVQALRDAKGIVEKCFSIFNYGFPIAENMFDGKTPFKDDQKISTHCALFSLLNFDLLLDVGISNKYITPDGASVLKKWSADPEKWSNDWKANHPE